MRKPNWDTEAGRRMWLAGKKDAEIADEFGISVHAVTNYRLRYWQGSLPAKKSEPKKTTFSLQEPVAAGAGVDPAVLDKIRDNAQRVGINLPDAAAPESPLAGMKAFDFERGLKPPAEEPKVVPSPAAETIPQSPQAAPAPFTQGSLEAAEDRQQEIATPPVAATPHQSLAATASPQGEAFTVPKPRLDEMDIMAAATEHLSGMQAVCTACAIQALWFWTGPADLRRAKKNIDWLLDHMEG